MESVAKDLPIVLVPGESGFVVATCPVIPGCVTQGATREEALENIKEAIALALECRAEEGWQLPAEYEVLTVSAAA
ncbi:type II toxin-antitoxin system HicB family antitoxin [Acidobacteria bacterium ACD]|nr:MAG: type II toxin-antitoxin system HicB family antitoxin [Acidobacteriota bacterium]MCE7958491.1 type II toxin-antitoxin system HicB family antitoxin [Acidobacteria bacterium ACB2]MDL1950300.1 type II toxin-antitoxin system HicB family antitoxin [Acidobacteria bacterium ACD]